MDLLSTPIECVNWNADGEEEEELDDELDGDVWNKPEWTLAASRIDCNISDWLDNLDRIG